MIERGYEARRYKKKDRREKLAVVKRDRQNQTKLCIDKYSFRVHVPSKIC